MSAHLRRHRHHRHSQQPQLLFQRSRCKTPLSPHYTPSQRSNIYTSQGLENNDGIFMVASTNHLDQLDPGLSSRPSRFDRKYLFPLPSEAERIMYCQYWREKLKSKPTLQFPKKLSAAIASITQDFSFAYLKEAFVATLLAIAGNRSESGIRGGGDDEGEGGDLDDYELWREMKRQVRLLRDDMDTRDVVKYHTQDPLDLAWRPAYRSSGSKSPTMTSSSSSTATATTTAQPPPNNNAFSALPFRPGANRADRNLNNPRLMATDCDARHAPLMTDGGLFVDSRFDGISSAKVI